MLRSSALEWSTAVRCATGNSVVSDAICSVISIVRARVEPPAPYVTDTNDGCSDSSSRIVCHSSRSSSAERGGKNSKENVGPSPARQSRTNRFTLPSVMSGAWRRGAKR
jgi:hypothetical protein